MRAPESTAEVVRKLVALERIPMFADLPTIALATLARVAREVPAKAGEILPARPGTVLFAPDAVELVSPSRLALDDHAPSLAASLAGVAPVASRARADGVVLEVSAAALSAALEDDFSLFLAVSAAIAREGVEAGLTAPPRHDQADEPREIAPEHDRDLIADVLDLQAALPFASGGVGSLFQLARRAAEVRAHDGVELWRAGDNTDIVLFPTRGALAVRGAGAGSRSILPGSALAVAAALTRQERRFTAVARGEFAGLSLPLELFLDVLEDDSDLAAAVLRALARLAVGEESGS